MQYSAASVSLNMLHIYFTAKFLFFFDSKHFDAPALVPLGIVALLLTIGRVCDGASDLFTGRLISKYFTHPQKKGKLLAFSIPFILLGYAAVWMPASFHSYPLVFKVLYTAVCTNFFFTAYTMFAVPYDSFLDNICADDSERVRAAKYKTGFGLIGIACAIPFLGMRDIRSGAVLIAAAAFLPLAVSSSVFFKKEIVLTATRSDGLVTRKIHQKSITPRWTISLMCAVICIEAASNIFIKNIDYFTTHILKPHYLQSEINFQHILYAVFFSAIITGLFVWPKIADRPGKILFKSIRYLCITAPFFFFTGFIPGISPLMQTGLFFFIIGFLYCACAVMTIAVITRHAGIMHNYRHNVISGAGMIFGIYIFCRKLGISLGVLLYSTLLNIAGDTGSLIIGIRLTGILISILALISAVLLYQYNKFSTKADPDSV